MWRKSIVALAPNPRAAVAVALQAVDAFQTAAALVLALTQMKESEVMTITMWRNPTWAPMKE
eukprot:11359785-Ditylum_brightwellii.AAC.1